MLFPVVVYSSLPCQPSILKDTCTRQEDMENKYKND